MQINIRHSKGNIMESLQVTRDRMDEIVSTAQKKLIEKHPDGTKSMMLESLVKECNDVTEVVAATIVWGAITNQMETQRTYEKIKAQQAKDEFANKLKIER